VTTNEYDVDTDHCFDCIASDRGDAAAEAVDAQLKRQLGRGLGLCRYHREERWRDDRQAQHQEHKWDVPEVD
jgi:hypothetical protein